MGPDRPEVDKIRQGREESGVIRVAIILAKCWLRLQCRIQ